MAKDKEQEASYRAEGRRRAARRKAARMARKGPRCESCGTKLEYYTGKVINPYYQDISGIDIWQRMCGSCYESAMGDI